MAQDSKSELEKRIEGMDVLSQIKEILHEMENLRRDMAALNRSLENHKVREKV